MFVLHSLWGYCDINHWDPKIIIQEMDWNWEQIKTHFYPEDPDVQFQSWGKGWVSSLEFRSHCHTMPFRKALLSGWRGEVRARAPSDSPGLSEGPGMFPASDKDKNSFLLGSPHCTDNFSLVLIQTTTLNNKERIGENELPLALTKPEGNKACQNKSRDTRRKSLVTTNVGTNYETDWQC